MKDKILNRPWKHPEYSWRAIDKIGHEFYYRHKPTKGSFAWEEVEGALIDTWLGDEFAADDLPWIYQNWGDTLQHIKEHEKLINQSKP